MITHPVKFYSSSLVYLATMMTTITVVQSQTFDPESMVWTISGLGYNDFTVFICYGGQGETTTPFSLGASPTGMSYPNVESLMNDVADSGEAGCFPGYVKDPSDIWGFLGDCDLGDDSVVTVCSGPQPNGVGFQCGRYDWIYAVTVRFDPEGPSPNCLPNDNILFCPPHGKTRFQRYSFQTPIGVIFERTVGSCDARFFLGLNTDGILCGDGYGVFLTDHGGFWPHYSEPACVRPSSGLIDWYCPSDPNYPRSTGCRRARALSAEEGKATPWDEKFALTFDGQRLENIWSMDAFADLKDSSGGIKQSPEDKFVSVEEFEEAKLDLVKLQTVRPPSGDNEDENVERESSGNSSAPPLFSVMVMEACASFYVPLWLASLFFSVS